MVWSDNFISLSSIRPINYFVLARFAGKETLRCLALALKRMPLGQQTLSFDDEKDMIFIGLVCLFLLHMI